MRWQAVHVGWDADITGGSQSRQSLVTWCSLTSHRAMCSTSTSRWLTVCANRRSLREQKIFFHGTVVYCVSWFQGVTHTQKVRSSAIGVAVTCVTLNWQMRSNEIKDDITSYHLYHLIFTRIYDFNSRYGLGTVRCSVQRICLIFLWKVLVHKFFTDH